MNRIATLMAGMAVSLTAMAGTAPADTIPAAFPGGREAMSEYIRTNMRYPQAAMRNGIEGVVNVRFMVFPDGRLDSIGIVRLVDPDLEAESIRLVKAMPAWTPASVGGKPVTTESTVQVTFTLPE